MISGLSEWEASLSEVKGMLCVSVWAVFSGVLLRVATLEGPTIYVTVCGGGAESPGDSKDSAGSGTGPRVTAGDTKNMLSRQEHVSQLWRYVVVGSHQHSSDCVRLVNYTDVGPICSLNTQETKQEDVC